MFSEDGAQREEVRGEQLLKQVPDGEPHTVLSGAIRDSEISHL